MQSVRCRRKGTRSTLRLCNPSAQVHRVAISRQLPLDELRTVARAAGLRPLRDAALEMVTAGVITFGELRDMIRPDLIAGAAESVPAERPGLPPPRK